MFSRREIKKSLAKSSNFFRGSKFSDFFWPFSRKVYISVVYYIHYIKCNKYTLKSSYPDRCARLWLSPVITWDGKVLPCCFDKDASYVMGDLNEDNFREIWTGTKYVIFRKSVLSGRAMIDICRNCTSGLRVMIKG